MFDGSPASFIPLIAKLLCWNSGINKSQAETNLEDIMHTETETIGMTNIFGYEKYLLKLESMGANMCRVIIRDEKNYCRAESDFIKVEPFVTGIESIDIKKEFIWPNSIVKYIRKFFRKYLLLFK